MNTDAFVNRLAFISGKSRKEVLETLKGMSADPTVQKSMLQGRRNKKKKRR